MLQYNLCFVVGCEHIWFHFKFKIMDNFLVLLILSGCLALICLTASYLFSSLLSKRISKLEKEVRDLNLLTKHLKDANNEWINHTIKKMNF